MAKGFYQTGDESVEVGTYKKLDNGFYRVNGIGKYISQDDNEEPVFSIAFGEQLKFSFEFRTVDGSQGPACGLLPADFYAMAVEFGVSLAGVSAKNKLSSAVLKDTIEKINASSKTLSVESKDGWVNYIPNTHYTGGIYTVKFINAIGNDDAYGFKFGKGNNYLSFLFEIVGDIQGKPSLFDGGKVWVYMNAPWVDSAIVNGEVVTSEQAQCPLWQKDEKSGGDTPAVKKWKAFIKHFAPEVLEHDWTSDPLKSKFGINELASPQTVVISYALGAGKKRVVYYDKAKTRYSFNMLDLDNLNTEDVVEDIPDIEDIDDVPFNEAVENIHNKLYAFIIENWKNITVFDAQHNFTEEGKIWAKEYLSAPWREADLGKKVPLNTLTHEQAAKLLLEFQKLYSDGETW